jgi:hypothetical protein
MSYFNKVNNLYGRHSFPLLTLSTLVVFSLRPPFFASSCSLGPMLKRSAKLLSRANPALNPEPVVTKSTSALRELLTVVKPETRVGPQTAANQYTGMQLDDWATQIRLSDTHEHAKIQARSFYRRILRRLPSLLVHYKFHEIPPQEAVKAVKHYFTEHPGTDAATMDRLRWQGEVTMADVVRNYLTYSHVSALLFPDVMAAPQLPASAFPAHVSTLQSQPENSGFLDEFLDTRPFKPKVEKFNGPVIV